MTFIARNGLRENRKPSMIKLTTLYLSARYTIGCVLIRRLDVEKVDFSVSLAF